MSSYAEKHTRCLKSNSFRCGACNFNFTELEENDNCYCIYGESSFSFYCDKCYKQYNIESNIRFSNLERKFYNLLEAFNKSQLVKK